MCKHSYVSIQTFFSMLAYAISRDSRMLPLFKIVVVLLRKNGVDSITSPVAAFSFPVTTSRVTATLFACFPAVLLSSSQYHHQRSARRLGYPTIPPLVGMRKTGNSYYFWMIFEKYSRRYYIWQGMPHILHQKNDS